MQPLTNHSLVLPNKERLRVSFEKNYRNLRITQGETELAHYEDGKSIELGRIITTAAGERVNFVIDHAGLAAWHNNIELISGVASGTVDYFTHAIYGLWTAGGICLAMHTAAVFNDQSAIIGCVLGLLLIGLGFWAKSTDDKTPLLIAFVLLIVGVLMGMVSWLFGIPAAIYAMLGYQKGSLWAAKKKNTSSDLLDVE